MPDAVAHAVKRVVDVENRAPGIAEDGVHALFLQAFNQDLRTVPFHADILSRASCRPVPSFFPKIQVFGTSSTAPRFPLVTIAA